MASIFSSQIVWTVDFKPLYTVGLCAFIVLLWAVYRQHQYHQSAYTFDQGMLALSPRNN